jgi:hypothetical protein
MGVCAHQIEAVEVALKIGAQYSFFGDKFEIQGAARHA